MERIIVERMKFTYTCRIATAYPTLKNRSKIGKGPGHWHTCQNGRLTWMPTIEADAWFARGEILV